MARYWCLPIIGLVSCALSPARAQERSHWGSKESREDLVLIYEGKKDVARENLAAAIERAPNRVEPLFVMACLEASEGNADPAWEWLDRALAAGMPPARVLAGPRDLLASLHRTDRYRELLAKHRSEPVHGPLLGNVTATSASFWLRTAADQQQVEIKVRDAEGNKIAGGRDRTRAADDFTTQIHVANLKPSTDYHYQVQINGTLHKSDDFAFRTFPEPGSPHRFTVVFGGGAAYTPEYERMFTLMQNRKPDLFLQLGDNVYIDQPETPGVQRYCYYRRQSSAPYRRLTASTCVASIWDDHDFFDNDSWGGPERDVPGYKPMVWKIFSENWCNPPYAGGGEWPGCYYDFLVGDVHFIMLDCRFYRTDPKVENPTMLGPRQKEWLKRTLANSESTFKVVATSVPFAAGTKGGSRDTWDGFPAERVELGDYIVDKKIEGVFFIAADRHRSDAWPIEHPGLYPTIELMSSRITNIHIHKVMPESYFGYNRKRSFGHLTFDTTKDDPEVIYRVVNEDGEVMYRYPVKRSELEGF